MKSRLFIGSFSTLFGPVATCQLRPGSRNSISPSSRSRIFAPHMIWLMYQLLVFTDFGAPSLYEPAFDGSAVCVPSLIVTGGPPRQSVLSTRLPLYFT